MLAFGGRFTLDTKGGGFEWHIGHDHNLWHYLFLIVHVREKDETEHNGWEAYVARLLQRGDLSFFPRNNAISLSEVKLQEDAERNVFFDQQAIGQWEVLLSTYYYLLSSARR